jgi:hypothetical protein
MQTYRLEREDGRPGKELVDPRFVNREGGVAYGGLGRALSAHNIMESVTKPETEVAAFGALAIEHEATVSVPETSA